MSILQGFNDLGGSVHHVTCCLPGSETPAKHDLPEHVEQGLIVVDFSWYDKCRQDDATFSSINHIMGMVTQVCSPSFETHGGGIGIRGADPQVRCPLVGAMDFALGPTLLSNPIMSSRVVSSQFLTLRLGNGWGERKGFWR